MRSRSGMLTLEDAMEESCARVEASSLPLS